MEKPRFRIIYKSMHIPGMEFTGEVFLRCTIKAVNQQAKALTIANSENITEFICAQIDRDHEATQYLYPEELFLPKHQWGGMFHE